MSKKKKEVEVFLKNFKKDKKIQKDLDKNSSFSKILNEIFLSLIFIVLVLIVILIVFFFLKTAEEETEIIPACGDGTFYGTCSLNKPYICDQGVLTERASLCGCPDDFYKDDDFCISEYHVNSLDLSFNYVLRGEEGVIDFRAYFGILDEISYSPKFLSYEEGELFLRSDFKLNRINNKLQRQAILPLVIRIQNMAPNNKEDQARIAISLIQNIPYNESENYLTVGKTKLALSRFPYQVLFDQSASCEGKSELLILILKELGYGVSLFYYNMENHEAVGIKCPLEYSLDGSGYCFVETTSPSIITDDSGEYFGAGKLFSSPEVIILSDGISLSENIYEYGDAKFYSRLRYKGEINFFNVKRWNEIKEKYGLNNGV